MIYVLLGDNDFTKRERLSELVAGFGVTPERLDGEELEAGALRDLFQGQTLFSDQRVVVVSGLSDSPAWSELPTLAADVANEIILLESKLDKRTAVYKWLKKHATVEEFLIPGERDQAKVIDWCVTRAKAHHGFALTRALATEIVARLGHDQARLDRLLEQLSLAEQVDQEMIDRMVPLPRQESVFGLFEAALDGNRARVQEIIRYLEMDSGPDGAYQTLGLLVSQLVPLNALVLGGSAQDVAKDFSVHPYAAQKMAQHARRFTVGQVAQMNDSLVRADRAMKTTNVSPWLLLEAALVEIGTI